MNRDDGCAPGVAGVPLNDPAVEHALKNYLGIVLGFAEVLVEEADTNDPRLEDFKEIHKAALAAVNLVNGKQADA